MDIPNEVNVEEKESCGTKFKVDGAISPIIGDYTTIHQTTDCRRVTSITIVIPDGRKGTQLIINQACIQTRIKTLYFNHSYPSPYILVNELRRVTVEARNDVWLWHHAVLFCCK